MKKNKLHTNNFVLYWILAIALAFACASCHTENRQQRKTQEYLFKHPEFSAGYCAEQCPVKDSIVTRDSIRFDTLYVPDDSGIEPGIMNPGDNIPQVDQPPKPITRYIIKTIRKDSIIYKRDAAEERRLQLALQACQGNNTIVLNKNDALQAKVDEWKGKAKTRWWWIAALIGSAVTYTVIKFRKNILSLKNKLT